MKRIMFLGAGLLFSLFVHAQNSATASASISVEIIHPVGTGKLGDGTAAINLAKKIRVFNETDQRLITEAINPRTMRIVNYGTVFDTSIEMELVELRRDQPLKTCRITVYFN